MQHNVLDNFMHEDLEKDKIWEVFIGDGVDYYLPKWKKFENGDGAKIKFNFWILIFPVLWFANRKMYAVALLVMFLSSGTAILSSVLNIINIESIGSAIGWLPFLVKILTCLYGNYIYYYTSLRKIDAIYDEHGGSPHYKSELSAQGGTNTFHAVLFIIVAMVLQYVIPYTLNFIL